MRILERLLKNSLIILGICCFLLVEVAWAEKNSAAAVYQQKVTPLTTLECAQCHFSVFADIRDNGGLHQLECRFCHQTFHSLRPGIPWEDVVPHCDTCHGEIHGLDFKQCLECHADPHAPMHSLVNMDMLGQSCGACHASQGNEVQQFPSAHTEVACSDCHHDRHGYIPSCLECHDEPHSLFKDNAGCMACHPVHSPLEIAYGQDIVNETCGACHDGVQKTHQQGIKKHAALFCVYCHESRHRYIPQCRDCHAQPHSENLLQKFSGCAECHGDPHALKLGD